MGARQRLGFAVVAVLIAIVAVVVLAGGSDEDTNVADRPPATATSEADATPTPSATPEETAAATPTATPEPTPEPPETVRFRNGEVAGGPARLTFTKGDRARFRIVSDVADEVHVHGYDLSKDVRAGGSVTFSFPARIEGVFEVELESRGAQLAQLRVEP